MSSNESSNPSSRVIGDCVRTISIALLLGLMVPLSVVQADEPRQPVSSPQDTKTAVEEKTAPPSERLKIAAGESKQSPDEARQTIDRGLKFLLDDQNPDGSWGGPREAIWTFTGWVWSNPETHRCWKMATTGLGCMAVLSVGKSEVDRAAAERSIDFMIANADIRRPSDWDTMNSWAYIYGVQALAAAYVHPWFAESSKRPAMKQVAEEWMKRLEQCQTPIGGWGYLEFDPPRTPRQQWSTSFTTAAGVVAICDARDAGFQFSEAMLKRAVRAVKHCKLPTGAYTYSINTIPDPRGLEWIDQIQGSLSRIQVANEAQMAAGENLPLETLKTGLSHFFKEHRFLDIARGRPIPHETYYYNSGYFYFFGHFYAARIIARLPKEDQEVCWPRLRYEISKTQLADGSMIDYDMHAYHKPYGTAYALLSLKYSLPEPPEGEKP